ncbi:MAG: MerR family transcriptional regulator [Muribaculaceae bacterium]|nr:MerR family transcriptional regulator [Muribaculaceae bacterium]
METTDKLYYSVSEVSELTELPASTLRFWESQFTELRPHRTPKGQRRYTTKDIETIRMLRFLLYDRGLKLEAAREELKRNREGVDKRAEVVKRLQDIRTRLMKILEATGAGRR